jgi:hypothetical protein
MHEFIAEIPGVMLKSSPGFMKGDVSDLPGISLPQELPNTSSA